MKITISTDGDMALSAKNISLDAKEAITLTAGKTVAAAAGEKEIIHAQASEIKRQIRQGM